MSLWLPSTCLLKNHTIHFTLYFINNYLLINWTSYTLTHRIMGLTGWRTTKHYMLRWTSASSFYPSTSCCWTLKRHGREPQKHHWMGERGCELKLGWIYHNSYTALQRGPLVANWSFDVQSWEDFLHCFEASSLTSPPILHKCYMCSLASCTLTHLTPASGP